MEEKNKLFILEIWMRVGCFGDKIMSKIYFGRGNYFIEGFFGFFKELFVFGYFYGELCVDIVFVLGKVIRCRIEISGEIRYLNVMFRLRKF